MILPLHPTEESAVVEACARCCVEIPDGELYGTDLEGRVLCVDCYDRELYVEAPSDEA